MSHFPINHHLRPLYRTLATVVALYVIVFGAIGAVRTAGDSLFSRGDVTALGLRTNLAFSVASIVVGAAILLALVAGRNVDTAVTRWGGVVFMAVGMAMMAVLHTDLNVLNFSMATVVVSSVLGVVLFAAGLYLTSGSSEQAAAEEVARHGGH